jgi:hypothetical protein
MLPQWSQNQRESRVALRKHAVLLGVLTLVLAMTLFVKAVQAEAFGREAPARNGEINLSAQQKADFAEQAGKLADLDDEQIAKALRDPRIFRAIPIREVVTTSEAASPQTEAGGLQARAYAKTCRTFTVKKEIANYDNEPILKFTAYKDWCFNGDRVESVTMRVVPWIAPDLRGTPDISGYVYRELTERRVDEFVTVDGRRHGGHKSIRWGRFEWRMPAHTRPVQILEVNAGRVGEYNGECSSAGSLYDIRFNYSPSVTGTTPAARTMGVASGTNITATFDEPVAASTINRRTFKLFKLNTTTPIPAVVSYDSTSRKAALNPSADLAPRTTYQVRILGGTQGVKDTQGLELATDKRWSFRTK